MLLFIIFILVSLYFCPTLYKKKNMLDHDDPDSVVDRGHLLIPEELERNFYA